MDQDYLQWLFWEAEQAYNSHLTSESAEVREQQGKSLCSLAKEMFSHAYETVQMGQHTRTQEGSEARAQARHYMGIALRLEGKADCASPFHAIAVKLDPYRIDFRREYILSLVEEKEYQDALLAVKNAISLAPENGQVIYSHARLLDAIGLSSNAISCYKGAISKLEEIPREENAYFAADAKERVARLSAK